MTIRQLIHSPAMPLYVQQLQLMLQEEQERRERFYEEMSEEQKVEFINGEVIVHTPVQLRHNIASQNLLVLLNAYVRKHHLGFVGHEKILISLTRNDYEPDICYFGQAKAQAFEPEQMKFPPPDFVAEILSPTTEAIDRGIKFQDYAAHGVAEYWIIDPHQEFIEQYAPKGNEYELLVKVKTGTIQSVVVNGFDVPVRAIFDEMEQFTALQQILEGREEK
ncbi:MAG TPA: Uma2 family endonuclease [Anaerolineae bacterium]|nr:Uma2 family endonuclease [Anaerolineae bacterium]